MLHIAVFFISLLLKNKRVVGSYWTLLEVIGTYWMLLDVVGTRPVWMSYLCKVNKR